MNLFLELWNPQGLHYNYFLELCSLVLLTAISISYFTRKKFPSPLFKLFGYILVFITTNVFVNVMSCFVLDKSATIPLFFVEMINDIYYSSNLFLSFLLFAYVLYSLGKSMKYMPIYNLTTIPTVLAIIFVCTNGLHKQVFELVRDANGVVFLNRGPLFFILYIITGLNVACTFAYIIILRHRFDKKLVNVLISIIILVGAANIIQFFQPHHLLCGVAYTLSMIFTIITINDPDEKVDRISGAFNNGAFIEYINTQRIEKQNKFIIIFDVDNVSMFISNFGPKYYHELLSQIRKFIEVVNPDCYIFRTQSNRFVLMIKTKEEQNVMLGLLKEKFDQPFNLHGQQLHISIRLFYFKNEGVFKDSDTYNDFLNRTLNMLNFREDNYVNLDKQFLSRVQRDKRIKEILEDSLKKKSGFYMVYQPILDSTSKRFNHFEALIRLNNDELGYVGPAEFIPIAESFGLANDIDNFVLNETCAFLKRNPQIEHLEINVSCAEFFNNPSERFLKTIKKYGVDPSRICLEITETVAVKYPTKTKQFMEDLGQYGIEFAMDDFGSGYSNMARFITMPFSVAKLDKSLLGEERNIKIFLNSAISLFKDLNIPIVIEGVETEKQLKVAKAHEIDFIQGYYFSKPLKEEDLIKFLKSHEA